MPRHQGGGHRMVKSWQSMGTNIIQSVSADVTGIVSGVVNNDHAFTVLRILGEWSFGADSVNVIDDTAAITVGVGVFSTDAATLGGTALPDPEDEPEYPWLYWKSALFEQTVAQQHSGGDPRIARVYEIDVKSMRKVKPRESLAMVFQYRDINGAPGVNIVMSRSRVLIAL